MVILPRIASRLLVQRAVVPFVGLSDLAHWFIPQTRNRWKDDFGEPEIIQRFENDKRFSKAPSKL
jgi:hypothetical protein